MCADGCANGALTVCADATNVSALTLLTHTVPYRGSDGAPHGDCAITPTPRCRAAARQSGTVALLRPRGGPRKSKDDQAGNRLGPKFLIPTVNFIGEINGTNASR
jgi:hypothetical protein